MQYADLITGLQNWAENSGAEFLAEEPHFIELGEARCYREIDFNVLRKYATATLTVGSALISQPSDIYVPRWMILIDLSGNRTGLISKDVSFVSEYWPNRTLTAAPVYYANWDYANFLLAPTPDSQYTVELAYTYRPAAISAANPSTWLSTHCADLLFYAMMVEAATFMKQTPQAAAADQTATFYETRYQQAKTAAMAEERRKRGDEYRDNEPR